MKILHTADWHLGKKLHKKDLSEDHILFFDWLIEHIKAYNIDVLLISGDVFDSSNPPHEARMLYYGFLKQLIETRCRVVVTGGNHDAPAMLDAPRDLLALLDISVVGGPPAQPQDVLIPLPKNAPEIVIAAIPYLRDADLRQAVEGETTTDRVEAVRAGIKAYYDRAAQLARDRYPTLPVVAAGHLYAQGAISSESEREIQMGNLAAFGADEFSSDFVFVALGHIHRPQRVGNSDRVRYSGSPIPLSFSEKTDQKIVLVLTVEKDKPVQVEEVVIPKFRHLRRISGSFEHVKQQLVDFQSEAMLKALLEVEVEEENYNPLLVRELNEIVSLFDSDEAEVLKHKITFKNVASGTDELFESGQRIDEISERDILIKRLDRENALTDEHRRLVLEAFEELLQMVKEST